MKENLLVGLCALMVLMTSCGNLLAVDMVQRPSNVKGSVFAETLVGLTIAEREALIWEEIEKDSIPAFQKEFCVVSNEESIDGEPVKIEFQVSPEYFCIGSDEDYFLCPITPGLAQRIADRWNCILPTRKMVDLIYRAAEVKLAPSFMTPDNTMVTVPVFIEHNEKVRTQRAASLTSHPLGALVGGHKKDVVITDKLYETQEAKVAIYGWHQLNGQPIQPLYTKHSDQWVDYSHGIRFIKRRVKVDGEEMDIGTVLKDPKLYVLLSDEGVMQHDRYPEG